LCIAPCPVDCIELRPAAVNPALQAPLHRQRYAAHRTRLAARAAERQQQIDAQKAAAPVKFPPR
jgi:Na+-translocating ferredoxin:NAD+ oxidoreductase RNF subunit RnfB